MGRGQGAWITYPSQIELGFMAMNRAITINRN